MYKSILVAIDGSETANKALDHALALAGALDARLTLVTVTPQAPTFDAAEIGWSVPESVFDEIRRAHVEKGRTVLRAAVARCGRRVETVQVEDERPYHGILDSAAQVGADLIVMGSHGYRGLERLVLGSQAIKVLTHSSLPVLIVKP